MLFVLGLLLAAVPSSVRITDSTGAVAVSVTAPGVTGTQALAVQGVTGGIPLNISGVISVAGTADIPGNTATFNANNVCTSVLAAGEQSVGFHLSAGTLDATLTAYYTQAIGAVNCATAGTCTQTTFTSGATIVVTNPNGVKDVGINVVGGIRQVEVCTTTFNSGTTTGLVTATFVQAAISGGGAATTATQGPAAAANAPWSMELSDGASFYTGTKTGQLPTALDGSGFLKVHEQGTATITGTVTLGAGAAVIGHVISDTGSTTAVTGNVTVVQATGTNLHVVVDANSAVIGHVITDTGSTTAVTGTVTVTGTVAATQSGTWTVQPGNTANTTPWLMSIAAGGNTATVTAGNALKVDGSAVTQPISGTVSATQSGAWNITNISGTVSLPTGAATDASVTGLEVAQGSTTSGQKGVLSLCAVTTAAPTYTTAQSAPCSVDTAGNLRITGTISASNPSVSSTGAAVPASATYLGGNKAGNLVGVTLDGSGNLNVNVAAGGGAGGTSSSFGAAFPATGTAVGFKVVSSAPTLSNGNMEGPTLDTAGNVRVNLTTALPAGANVIGAVTQSGTWTVTANAGTGTFNMQGLGTFGSTSGGVLGVQGDPTGTPLPISTNASTILSVNDVDHAAVAATLSAACTVTTACTNVQSIQWAVTGSQSAEVVITAVSAPVGITTACDLSYDGGTTYQLAKCVLRKSDPTSTGTVKTALANGDLVANTSWTLLWDGAPSHVRVRVSLLTSGSATFAGRAVLAPAYASFVGAAITNGAPINAAGSSIAVFIGGVDQSTATTGRAWTFAAASTAALTTAPAGIVALSPNSPMPAFAHTALPAAGGDGTAIPVMADKFGRLVTTANADRALITQNTVTLTASTAETTLLTAVASTFLDLTELYCTNTSTSSNVITIRDTTAGTMRLTIACQAVVGPCEGWVFSTPWKQTAVNTNWTVQAGTSASSVICAAQAVQNK